MIRPKGTALSYLCRAIIIKLKMVLNYAGIPINFISAFRLWLCLKEPNRTENRVSAVVMRPKIPLKKSLKSKLFIIPLLFLITFGIFMALTYMVVSKLKYPMSLMNWETAAEISAAVSALLILMRFHGSKKREYKDIEQGSARWGKKKDMALFTDKNFQSNIILSSEGFLSMDMRKTHRACHVLVVGGSGAGKSRFYALPIVNDISRLGRDYLKVGQIMEILRQKNVRLITVNDGVDSARDDDDFTPFRNIMNEFFVRDTSRKIKSVFKAKGMTGKHLTGTVIYGYLWADERAMDR